MTRLSSPLAWCSTPWSPVPAGGMLWALSTPGLDVLWFAFCAVFVAIAALVWFVRVALTVTRNRSRSWWFALAPFGAFALGIVVVADVPRRVRFEFGRSDCDAIARAHPPLPTTWAAEEWARFDPPDWLGSYCTRRGARIPGGVVIYEATGAFFDDAGFAYLPDGPDAVRGTGWWESPTFRSLGGGWCAWTASW